MCEKATAGRLLSRAAWGIGLSAAMLAAGSWALAFTPKLDPDSPTGRPVDRGETAAATATSIGSDFFGMDINSIPASWPKLGFGVLRLWGTSTRWDQIETSRGSYNFASLDEWLSAAQANGQSVLYTFGGVPRWVSSVPTDTSCTDGAAGVCDPPADLKADGSGTDQSFKDFVAALVAHAGPRIRYYEIWNEVNNKPFWKGTAPQLVRMAQDARAIIKAAQPDAVVLTPDTCVCDNSSLTGGKYTSTNPQDGMNFYLGTAVNGVTGAEAADGVAFHPYLGSASPQGIVYYAQQMKSVMAAHGVSALPLWDTESSWGQGHWVTGCPDSPPYSPACEANMTAFLGQSYALGASAGLSHYIWYAYNNTSWGTLSYQGALLPAGVAYGQMAAWLSGASIAPCQESGSVWTCRVVSASGDPEEIVWNSSGTSSYPTTFAQAQDLTGAAHALAGSAAIGPQPVLLLGRSVSVAISPKSAALAPGQTQQFSAVVAGATDTGVTWTASDGVVSAAGLFTAPTVDTATDVTVTATSRADGSESASATVTVAPIVAASNRIIIGSPIDGAVVGDPVPISASASYSCGATDLQLYDDGTCVINCGHIGTAKIDQAIRLSASSAGVVHRLTFKAWCSGSVAGSVQETVLVR